MPSSRPPRQLKRPRAGPDLKLLRFYDGWTRNDMLLLWSTALRSGKFKQHTEDYLHDPTVYVGSESFRFPGTFCPLGVLCLILGLPSQATPKAAYADVGEDVFDTKQLPPELFRFLVPMTPNYTRMEKVGGAVFNRLLRETKLTRQQLLLMNPTIPTLNSLGLSFEALSVIVRMKFYNEDTGDVRSNPAVTDGGPGHSSPPTA